MPGPLDGFPGGFVAGRQIHPVHHQAGKAVALGPGGHIANRHLQALRHRYGIAVVFADKDDGQFMDAGKVHRFVGFALAGGPVAEIDQGNGVVAQHLAAEGIADRLGQPGGDHIGKLDDAARPVGALQGKLAGVAVGVAGFAHKGKHNLGGGEAGGLDAQVPVVGKEKAVAVFFGGEEAAQLGRFVALAGGGDGDFALAVHHPDAFVDGAHQGHAAVGGGQVGRGQAGRQGPGRAGGGLARRGGGCSHKFPFSPFPGPLAAAAADNAGNII